LVLEFAVLLAVCALIHVDDHRTSETKVVLESDVCIDVAVVGPAWKQIASA
jgi:hypothetical protein